MEAYVGRTCYELERKSTIVDLFKQLNISFNYGAIYALKYYTYK